MMANNAKVAENHEQNGYYIARGLIPQEEVAEIHDVYMDAAKDGPIDGISDDSWQDYDRNDPLRRYPRMMQPHRHPTTSIGQFALKYLNDLRIRGVLSALFDDYPVGAQTMFYFKPPGSRGQELHQDNFYLRASPGTCMAAWIAVDDSDPENGGMFVVPQTHQMEIVQPREADPTRFFTTHSVEPPEGSEAIPVHLTRGDVLFFNGSVIHGSYPNESPDRFRRALINHYVTASIVTVSSGYQPLVRSDGGEFYIGQPSSDA
jgi:phytanoyl-CoA hydroxylase